MRRLDVHFHGTRVGTLQDDAGLITFTYDLSYIAGNGARPISHSLPLQTEPIPPPRPGNFFGNLLPEGEVRALIARSRRIEESDDIALLAAIGQECAGALELHPADAASTNDSLPLYRPLSPVELGQLIEQTRANPTATYRGTPARLSLAGAQTKTAVALFGEQLYQCVGGASTHILKPENERFPGLVYNEFICHQLARACGIITPDVSLLPMQMYAGGPVEDVFCTRRFDRKIMGGQSVRRLHQEDMCQVLGMPAGRKYEADDGISLQDIVHVLRNPHSVSVPALCLKRFVQQFVFNLLIGNCDAHAKNYSLLDTETGKTLAPAYDLVSTAAFADLDTDLPQHIGGVIRLEALARDSLLTGSKDAGLPPKLVDRELTRQRQALQKAMTDGPAAWTTLTNSPEALQSMFDRIRRVVQSGLAAQPD